MIMITEIKYYTECRSRILLSYIEDGSMVDQIDTIVIDRQSLQYWSFKVPLCEYDIIDIISSDFDYSFTRLLFCKYISDNYINTQEIELILKLSC